MYNLPHHKEHDPQVIRDFITQFPFAFMSGVNADLQPVATQIPLFLEEREGKQYLMGHMMRNQDHHKAWMQNPNVLAVFTGRHTYVSATWYTNQNTASTWNYSSVHAKGTITFLENDALEDMLRKTSMHFENNNPDSPTVFDNLSEEFLKKVMPAIVAFEIEVTKLDTVFKLSQDRDEASYENIMEKLKAQDKDGQAVAEQMEKRQQQVFPKGE
ncbi:MAG TPA: hypothetical protein DCE41_33050 [Cytophagales bacterium]|nr:hypothetical protein [Cytophagales bacterium]HAA21414.1 hypothetical protein [Cytophagales bacterium]HAP59074.1 hypothetical protein [Cytophagales bacterium]